MTRYDIILKKPVPVVDLPVQAEEEMLWPEKKKNFEFPVFEAGGIVKAEDLNHIVNSIKILNNRTKGLKRYNPEEKE